MAFLALVPCGPSPKLSGSGLKKDFQETWRLPVGEVERKERVLSFEAAGANVVVALMPAPIPYDEIEEACETALMFPDAPDIIRPHQSHFIVTIAGELNPLAESTLLTQAVASLLKVCDATLGVLWVNAQHIVAKQVFVDFATEMLSDSVPPLMLWIELRAGDNDGRTAGFTRGLAPMGLMEMESLDATEEAGDLRERFLDIASYLLENGPIINDGDTVGQTTAERIKVVYSDSSFGLEGRVMRLVYGGGKKPWWKFW